MATPGSTLGSTLGSTPGSGGKTKTLSLCEKLQLIEEHEERKASARQLALIYGIGKTQVYETLKNKEKIKRELLKGTSGQRKRIMYMSSFDDINAIMWDWFSKRLAEGLPVSGPMIQAEALTVARSLGKTAFKASNGWLESFRSRHNIVYNQGCVEAKDVIVEIKVDGKDDIARITEGAFEEDIYIAMETGLLYKMLPGCVDSGDKLGVLLCVNMRGSLLKPLVVGKTARPACFGKLDAVYLPVQWKPSCQGRLTNFVLEEWLLCLNEMAVLENRTVTLFLDAGSCHPLVSLSNVRLVRCVEPLDRGLVSHFKCLYRRSLLQTLVLRADDSSVADACCVTSVLDAVNWIGRAISNIPYDVVRKCFVKSGFTFAESMDCPAASTSVTDMEAEGRVCADILDLCGRLNLDAEEVMSFDDFVAQDEFHTKDESEGVEIVAEEDRVLNLRSYGDAIKVINGLEKFAADQSCPQLLNVLQDAKEALAHSCI